MDGRALGTLTCTAVRCTQSNAKAVLVDSSATRRRREGICPDRSNQSQCSQAHLGAVVVQGAGGGGVVVVVGAAEGVLLPRGTRRARGPR
eukprot:1188498-Prorocentrum_minimum.AAC.3